MMTKFHIGYWRHKIGKALIIFSLTAILLPYGVVAEAFQSELVIKADQLEMDENSEIATFRGDVTASEGEMALFADRMVVYYFKKKSGQQISRGGVHKVLASGHVIIEQADNKGHADRAEYVVGERKLILIGKKKSASIIHGGDRLSGKRILLTLGENRQIDKVFVLGTGKQRVSASIMPPNLKEKTKKSTKRARTTIRVKPKNLEKVEGLDLKPITKKLQQNKKNPMQLQIDSKRLSNTVKQQARTFARPKLRQMGRSSRSRPPLISPMRREE
jgi:lipopolysaccharide transport protein LptA